MSSNVLNSYLKYSVLIIIYAFLIVYNTFYATFFLIMLLLICAVDLIVLSKKHQTLSRYNRLLGIAAAVYAAVTAFHIGLQVVYDIHEIETPIIYIVNLVVTAIIFYTLHDLMLRVSEKWSRAQAILDVVVMTYVFEGVVISTVVNSPLAQMTLSQSVGFSVYSLIFVILLILSLVLLNTVSRLDRQSLYMGYIIGFISYALSDGSYIMSLILFGEGSVVLSQLLRLLAFISFILTSNYIQGDAQLKLPSQSTIEKKAVALPENFNDSKKIWLVFIVPLIAFAFNVVNVKQLGILLVGLVCYQIISYYLQKRYIVKIMLNKQVAMRTKLESEVEKRTMQLQHINEALSIRAKLDTLTGLHNRSHFNQHLSTRIADEHSEFALLYLDLDRFKIVNDLHGHGMGDEVLKIISKRLKQFESDTNTLARIGGDEFALIYNSKRINEIALLCRSIIQVISQPVQVKNFRFQLGVSIGISRYPHDAATASSLLKFADVAMYHAKSLDIKDRYVLYSNQLTQRIERRNSIENYLRTADIEHDFEMYYQPVLEINTGKIIGVESLIRWQVEGEGFVPPNEFIPVATEIGMIYDISKWVFKEVMLQIKDWNNRYSTELTAGINLSASILNLIEFIPMLKKLITDHGVNPRHLDLEVSENSAMTASEFMEDVFVALSELGVNISIDDFGTGYSSLSYLKRFKIDNIKIAKELIDNIEHNQDDLLIVKSIIMMADGMRLKTVAEGVETSNQYNLLQGIKCDRFQGFIYDCALPKEQFEDRYLKNKRSSVFS